MCFIGDNLLNQGRIPRKLVCTRKYYTSVEAIGNSTSYENSANMVVIQREKNKAVLQCEK